MNTQEIVIAMEVKDSRIASLIQELENAKTHASWFMEIDNLCVDVTSSPDEGWRKFDFTGYSVIKLQQETKDSTKRLEETFLVLKGDTLKKALWKLNQIHVEPSKLLDELVEQTLGGNKKD